MKDKKKASFLDHFIEKGSEEPEEETQEAPEQPVPPPPAMDKNRNSALMRYIAILFGVAFMLVLSSFILSHRDSQQTISQLNQNANSALANAEKLQNDNRQLQEEKTALQKELDDMKTDLEEVTGQVYERDKTIDTLEQEKTYLSQELETAKEDLQSMAKAYEHLYWAQLAFQEQRYEDCAGRLKELEPLVSHLQEPALTAYNQLVKDLAAAQTAP